MRVFLSVCLIAIVISLIRPSTSMAQLPTMPIYSALPSGPDIEIDAGDYQINDTYTPGSLAHWAQDGLTQQDEEGVFLTSLIYTGDGKNDFEVRMGMGGQFYSIITPLGELIGRQHTYASSFSRWNDAVLESVVTNTTDPRLTNATCNCNPNLSLNKNPDMNQGGTYIRDGLTDPFYSPQLRYEKLSAAETRSIIWTPPSALPTTFQSGILYDQRTRNMGNGVLEITQLISNFGPDTLENRQSIPWASFSGEQLDNYRYRDSDGTIVIQSDTSWTSNIVRSDDMTGWLAFIDEDHRDKLGMAIIFGGEKYASGGDDIWRHSDVRFGDLNRPQWPDTVDYIVSSRRSLNLYTDTTIFFRYYLAFGSQSALIAAADLYAPQVDYGIVAYTESNAPLTNLCAVNGRYTTENCTPTTATAHLYDYQVPHSKPVFLLRDTESGDDVYALDPYAISRLSADDPGRFYDGRTEYVEMLGWAVAADSISLAASEYTAEHDNVAGNLSGLDGYLFRTAAITPAPLSTHLKSADADKHAHTRSIWLALIVPILTVTGVCISRSLSANQPK